MGIEDKVPAGILLDSVEGLVGYIRKHSVWPATFGLACCAIEMIVAGRVSQKMAPILRQIYDQMADPKWVIAMGVCSSSGGMFNNYAIVQGVDHVVPVDIYLPGCPPRPEMLLHAIIELHEQVIQKTPLGANRERIAKAAEEAAMTAIPTSQMKGLLA